MTTEHVTAVLPVYNGTSTLERAAESLLAQTWPALDVVMVDDGSNDRSWPLLQRIATAAPDRVTVLRNPTNIGLARSLNRAIRSATGPWILRADQDDVSSPDRAQRLIDAATGPPGVNLVASLVNHELLDDAETWALGGLNAFEDRRRRLAGAPFPLTPQLLLEGNIFHHGEVMYRKDLWAAAGGYRPQFCMSEDYDLWLRMAGRTDAFIVDAALYTRRIGRTNSSHIFGDLQRRTADLAVAAARRRAGGLDDEQWSRGEILRELGEGPIAALLHRHLAPEEPHAGGAGRRSPQ